MKKLGLPHRERPLLIEPSPLKERYRRLSIAPSTDVVRLAFCAQEGWPDAVIHASVSHHNEV
jgi:hypothetical protein